MFAATAVTLRDNSFRARRVENLQKDWGHVKSTLKNQIRRGLPFRVSKIYLTHDTIRCLRYLGFTLGEEEFRMNLHQIKITYVKLIPH